MPEFLRNNWVYTLADPEFYEPLERLKPNEADFMELVRRMLPPDWRSERHSVWFYCHPERAVTPPQGWKIHLSTALPSAAPLLATVVPILVETMTPFKCALDRFVLRLLQSKGWSRGGAGKFATIYPNDVESCRCLLERLSEATIGFTGQYILSDRRFRNSAVVYYRYGGFHPTRRLDVEGEKTPVMRSVTGESIDDDRTPYFHLPDGVVDPFAIAEEEGASEEAGTLKRGRYQVTSAFGFGNAGGVYLAIDRMTGETVIIKEARPTTNQSVRVGDAIAMLKKEHRLLTRLAGSGIAPRAIDFFQDWEHFYLVEEYIEGETFRDYVRQHSRLAMKARPTRADVEEFWHSFQWIFERITGVMTELHARRIVFGDVSYNNVMISDGATVRLIDFEGAHELGVDAPAPFFTAGFAPRQKIDEGIGTAEDDWYAVGALMVNAMLPMTPLMALHPAACDAFLKSFVTDFGLPEQAGLCIGSLLSSERGARGGVQVARDAYSVPLAPSEPELRATNVDTEDWPVLLGDVMQYVDAMADFGRDDRLFPASPDVFRTNPLSIAYGACGVAYTTLRARGTVDPRVIEWIHARQISRESYPPGLYVGLAGVAWTLLELESRKRAEEILAMTFDHPLLHESPDLYFGVAGWGMTLLRFFIATRDESYLDRARDAGRFLLESRQRDEGMCWWPTAGREYCGLGHGAAGVALFLLYLSRATHDERYLVAGMEALQYVIRRANYLSDGVQSWRICEGEPTVTPYWRWGNAGIGMVLLRYEHVVRDGRYKDTVASLAVDVARKYSIFPGLHSGLAGMADFLIDMAAFTDDPAWARAAAKLPLSGMLHFKIPRPAGMAFPGDDRQRISCDFANGSIGVAYVIDRFLRGGPPAFMLDELLSQSSNDRAIRFLNVATTPRSLGRADALRPA